MEEQDTASKLKSRLGEWQAYVQQPTGPILQTPQDQSHLPFVWDAAPIPTPAPPLQSAVESATDARPAVNCDGSLVTRVVKYEARIAELQAALERDRVPSPPIAKTIPLDPAIIEPLDLPKIQDIPPPGSANLRVPRQEQPLIDLKPGLSDGEARANLILWILFGVLIVGIGSMLAITRIL
jgi:hypothetical protein